MITCTKLPIIGAKKNLSMHHWECWLKFFCTFFLQCSLNTPMLSSWFMDMYIMSWRSQGIAPCTSTFFIFLVAHNHQAFRTWSTWSKWSYTCIHNEAKISALVGCANIINMRKIEITNERSLKLGNVLMGNEIIPCCGLFGIHMLPPNHFNEP